MGAAQSCGFLQTGVLRAGGRLAETPGAAPSAAAQGGKMLPQRYWRCAPAAATAFSVGAVVPRHGVLTARWGQDTLLALPAARAPQSGRHSQDIIQAWRSVLPALTDGRARERVLPQGRAPERAHAVTPRRRDTGGPAVVSTARTRRRGSQAGTVRVRTRSPRQERGWRHGDRAQRDVRRRGSGTAPGRCPSANKRSKRSICIMRSLSPPAAADTLTAEVHRPRRPRGAARVDRREARANGLPGGDLQTRVRLQQVSEGGPTSMASPGLRSWDATGGRARAPPRPARRRSGNSTRRCGLKTPPAAGDRRGSDSEGVVGMGKADGHRVERHTSGNIARCPVVPLVLKTGRATTETWGEEVAGW